MAVADGHAEPAPVAEVLLDHVAEVTAACD